MAIKQTTIRKVDAENCLFSAVSWINLSSMNNLRTIYQLIVYLYVIDYFNSNAEFCIYEYPTQMKKEKKKQKKYIYSLLIQRKMHNKQMSCETITLTTAINIIRKLFNQKWLKLDKLNPCNLFSFCCPFQNTYRFKQIT